MCQSTPAPVDKKMTLVASKYLQKWRRSKNCFCIAPEYESWPFKVTLNKRHNSELWCSFVANIVSEISWLGIMEPQNGHKDKHSIHVMTQNHYIICFVTSVGPNTQLWIGPKFTIFRMRFFYKEQHINQPEVSTTSGSKVMAQRMILMSLVILTFELCS